MFGQCPSLRGQSEAVGPSTLTVKWFFPAAITAQPAVAADGTIYFDTDSGDGWEPGAIAEITPSGRVLALWRASGKPR